MRKAIALFLSAVLLVSSLPLAAEAASTFTLMVYLCGTDLETDDGSATDDLLEMIDAGLDVDGPVSVVVQTGGAYEWWVEGIDPDQTERWIIGDDAYCLASLPRQNMGKPDTLREFVAYCVTEFPADRYGLILWNHGGGTTTGICFDEYTNDYLTTEDVHDALSGAQQDAGDFRLAFVGFDACLMASFEMANYIKDFADYMIASEELAPGYGFDYEALLRALGDDPGMDMEAFGKTVADSFLETNLYHDPDDYMTLSVLNLSEMDALTGALESLSVELTEALDQGSLRTISRSRQNMRSFGDYHDVGSDMVDLKQFIEVFGAITGADTHDALDALDDVIVYSRYTENNLDNICGMSVLMPMSTRDAFDSYGVYFDPYALYPAYSEFITGYTAMLNGGDYVFTAGTPKPSSGWTVLSSLGENITYSGSGSGFQQIIQQVDEAAAADENAYGDDGVYAYSLALSREDMENLAYVEGNLMIDVSDEETEAYVDLGYLQNTVIDWDHHMVHSLFDGTWPVLEGQVVHMTDQIITGMTRRSLIDVLVNGEDVYLLAVFDQDRPQGEILGYTPGYTEYGVPARGYQRLAPGDVIIPQYYLYAYDENGEEFIEPFEGDPIEYTGTPLSFGYETLVGEDIDFAYTFCLNDIFGDYQFTNFIFFTL